MIQTYFKAAREYGIQESLQVEEIRKKGKHNKLARLLPEGVSARAARTALDLSGEEVEGNLLALACVEQGLFQRTDTYYYVKPPQSVCTDLSTYDIELTIPFNTVTGEGLVSFKTTIDQLPFLKLKLPREGKLIARFTEEGLYLYYIPILYFAKKLEVKIQENHLNHIKRECKRTPYLNAAKIAKQVEPQYMKGIKHTHIVMFSNLIGHNPYRNTINLYSGQSMYTLSCDLPEEDQAYFSSTYYPVLLVIDENDNVALYY